MLLHSWFVGSCSFLASLPYTAPTYWSAAAFVGADNGMSAAFSGFTWLQVLIGFGLYFGVSPWGLNAMKQAGAMKDPTARFFGMEHVAVMILAAIVAQVGRIVVKKTSDHTAKHKRAFLYFGIALLLILVMIPWGIWNPARPLFRF
jgi:hypothetical protein